MPSFVNIGAYVGEGTMVDTWATVGSCAQIGKNVHLSGGVGIGGVLEPLQAGPVIIEDGCFIGARSEVVEGVVVGEGAVLSMGVYLGASTKIVDRATGEVHRRPRAALFGGRPRRAARQAAARRHARPVALLRGDRQDGRRADPLQDRDQRAAARLSRSPLAPARVRNRSSPIRELADAPDFLGAKPRSVRWNAEATKFISIPTMRAPRPTPHVVRYVLFFSMLLVIEVAFAIIWFSVAFG